MSSSAVRKSVAPELHSGDRMSRAEFHRIYQEMPKSFKAELVGGTVFVASPLKRPHGTSHPFLITVVTVYAGDTPGVEVCDNTTILLGAEGEPQPDALLRVLPEYGGRSHTTEDDYVKGPPEWIAEIAYSSQALDLNAKRADYQRYGVLEYLVICLKEEQLRWFDLRKNKELKLPRDGICRVRSFPGLWIDAKALFAKDCRGLLRTLERGLATPAYAAFVRKLQTKKARHKKAGDQ